ncbi:MAG: ABC transporter permease [Candidatus Omnitrophica bacterium]|nr:ABC transporter permease [Candidatus Omnitrophota bacterium]
MFYPFFIALRYLFTKQKERFISLSSLISILGIAVGVGALIVVLGVMSGFDEELKAKMLGANSPIVVRIPPGADSSQVIQALKEMQGVSAIAPFVYGQALIKAENNVQGIILRGIDIEQEAKVSRIKHYIDLIEGSPQPLSRATLHSKEIILGKELKRNLGVDIGKEVLLISPVDRKSHRFRVSGVFNCGMYDYDANFAFIDLRQAQDFFALLGPTGIGIKPGSERDIWKLKKAIQKKLGGIFPVYTWMDLNKNFLSALKLEKTVMFIILTLIIIVACFNITSALTMNVLEKTRDIGILKAIGATNLGIKTIFIYQGLIMGGLGGGLGLGLGLGVGYLLKNYQFIKLPPDVYYLNKIPLSIQKTDIWLILLSTFLITLLATFYPARQAAKLDPVEALRYE